MRPFVLVALVSLSIVVSSSRALAQIEFAKSTIRITSVPATDAMPVVANEPAPTPKPATPHIEEPQPVEHSDPAVQQASFTTPTEVPVAPSPQTTKKYPVRQADFVASSAPRPLVHGSVPARAPSLVNVYSSSAAQATLNKMPRPTPVQPRAAAAPKQSRGKPFQGAQPEAAVSPYMNMYRNDTNSNNNMLNYFTLVRPQLQQQEASRQQAAELQKLRGQLQNLSSGAGAPNSASMTAHAHYMDTAQFYGSKHR